MSSKKQIEIPPFLSGPQVAAMLEVDRSTISDWFRAGKFPGAYKPGGLRTTILIPSTLFDPEQVKTFLKKERDQSVN